MCINIDKYTFLVKEKTSKTHPTQFPDQNRMRLSEAVILIETMPLNRESSKFHFIIKNPDNFSSSFHFFAICEAIPFHMLKNESASYSDRLAALRFSMPTKNKRCLDQNPQAPKAGCIRQNPFGIFSAFRTDFD